MLYPSASGLISVESPPLEQAILSCFKDRLVTVARPPSFALLGRKVDLSGHPIGLSGLSGSGLTVVSRLRYGNSIDHGHQKWR